MFDVFLQRGRFSTKAMQLVLGASVALSALGLNAPARAVVLDFEELPFTVTPPFSGNPNPNSVLTNQFAEFGILFGKEDVSAGVVVVENPQVYVPSSGVNSVVGLNSSGIIPSLSSGDIFFEFVIPGTLTPGVTDSVSFNIGDGGFDRDEYEIRAFNLENVLIDTQNFSEIARFPVKISTPGINRVEIDFTSSAGYSLDDLEFSTPVPEPISVAGSMLALGIGLGLKNFQKRKS